MSRVMGHRELGLRQGMIYPHEFKGPATSPIETSTLMLPLGFAPRIEVKTQ